MTTRQLQALQLADGGFPSVVTSRDGPLDDRNGFTAALVLRLVREVPTDAFLRPVRERALDFLMTCASPTVPEAFAFWPPHMRPAWAARVPADVDDTVVMLTELLRSGRVESSEAIQRFCRAVLPYRVLAPEVDRRPAWVIPGSFYTWIVPPDAVARTTVNIVDACVNANVAALLAFMNARHLPGYADAVHTVLEAIRWAGSDPRRLSAITPFYPTVRCLLEAVEHAVDCGVTAFQSAADWLESLLEEPGPADDAVCCRSAYGTTLWRCEAIAVARALARTHSRETAGGSRVAHRTC